MFRRLITAILVLPGLSIPVHAKDNACNSTAIAQLADYVLSSRTEAFSRFEKRNYGSTALYLKIVYGNVPEEEATEAVVDLFKENVRDADQLASAYLLSRYGYEKAADMLGPEFAPKFFDTTSNISLARAFMLSDERDMYLGKLATLETPLYQSHSSTDAVLALLDQPDDVKLQFAKEAEARSLHLMAAGFLLARSNLDEWEAFSGRYPGIEDWAGLIGQWGRIPPLHGRIILQTSERQKNTGAPKASEVTAILNAEYRLSESPILTRAINFTGRVDEAARAARNFEPLSTKNRFGDRPRLEVNRLSLYLDYYYASENKKELDAALSQVLSLLNRPFRLNLREEFDWLLGASAIGSPQKWDSVSAVAPAIGSPEFSDSWPLWVETVELIRSASVIDPMSMEPQQLAIAAELLFVNEMDSRLLSLFESAAPDPLLARLANDFAIRMDRTCAAFLERTGSGVHMISTPMYKFEKPPN